MVFTQEERRNSTPLIFKIIEEKKINLPKVLEEYNLHFKSFIFLTGENNFKNNIKQQIVCQPAQYFVVKEATHDQADEIIKKIGNQVTTSHLIVAVGGGTVNDVAKMVALKTGCEFISCPTTLSNDGLVSSNCTLKNGDSHFSSTQAKSPLGIIVNLNFIKTCPDKYIVAGIGDLVSNVSSLHDWKLAVKVGKEKRDDVIFHINSLATERILYYDYSLIKNKKEIDFKNSRFLYSLTESLVTSGLCMSFFGSSRPCSGSEHNLAHSMSKLHPESNFIHGFQVAFFTLITERLAGNDISHLEKLYNLVGLPSKFSYFGLNLNHLFEIIKDSPKVRNRYTILQDKSSILNDKKLLKDLIADLV